MPSLTKKKIIIPRRVPSAVIPIRKPVFITADKTTCVECPCFPKEDRYVKNKKIKPRQQTPLTLYELAAKVVDGLTLTYVFDWSESDVARWLADDIGLHQYTECFLNNHINGRRLILLEDPSYLAQINIKDFEHIKIITSKIRKLFDMEMIRFSRNMNLPERKPLTLCTLFKSRTGPTWGIRRTWNRCDILRCMKILMPKPEYLDHWDRVWYQKPDLPKVKFCRIEKPFSIPSKHIPHYKAQPDVCREIIVPRKFIIQIEIPETEQYIWMEKRPEPITDDKPKIIDIKTRKSRFAIKKISLTGLKGKDLVLARRKMAKPKFLP
ncbi:uncharacterized protein LOC135194532 [Vanessa tameamea]|uniref:Uncharacterized protein LOC135194532 n=1 Tax=Vanessa tameamea TaxID=334116 RepID=A0ABM4AY59_VANTA